MTDGLKPLTKKDILCNNNYPECKREYCAKNKFSIKIERVREVLEGAEEDFERAFLEEVWGGEKMKWEAVIINIQEGDIITSKKGLLTENHLLKRNVVNKRVKYLGDGLWEGLDEGVEANVKMKVKESE